jgi:hypothetical protein
MKRKILDFLTKIKVLKSGYVNPVLILIVIGVVIPMTMKFAYYKEEASKIYVSDEEMVDLILKTYVEEGEQQLVFDSLELIGTLNATIEPNSDRQKIAKIELEKSSSNLDRLLIKVKTDRNNLTRWDHFRLKVYQIALNIKKKYPKIGGEPENIYDWTMKTFYRESRYNHEAQNPHSSANGLFQAMASTRKTLRMTKNMSQFKQIEMFEEYITMQINSQKLRVENIDSAIDWYMITFYPALSDDSNDTVFAKCGGFNKIRCRKWPSWNRCNYHANSAYDMNKDGVIYKSEIGKHLLSDYK